MQINLLILIQIVKRSFNIAILAAVTVMLVAASAMAAAQDTLAAKKREYTQAESQANDCGNSKLPLNIGCQNAGSQIQGDENAVSLATEQRFPSHEVPSPPLEDTATLIVKTVVECPSGFVCPEPDDFDYGFIIGGGTATPSSFSGSSTGVEVTFVFDEEGDIDYQLLQGSLTTPPGLRHIVDPSQDCSGLLDPGETKTCIASNIYAPDP